MISDWELVLTGANPHHYCTLVMLSWYCCAGLFCALEVSSASDLSLSPVHSVGLCFIERAANQIVSWCPQGTGAGTCAQRCTKRLCRYNRGCLGARWAKATTVPFKKYSHVLTVYRSSRCFQQRAARRVPTNAAANLDKHTCELLHMLPPQCLWHSTAICQLPLIAAPHTATHQPSNPTVGSTPRICNRELRNNSERTSPL